MEDYTNMPDQPTPVEGFPIEESFEDFSGEKRHFIITCQKFDGMFLVDANEKGMDNGGYRFSALSYNDPYDAVGKLRFKIPRLLSTRHLTNGPDGMIQMSHDTLRGRFGHHPLHGVTLVVDGIALSPSQVYQIFDTHEGWQFKLTIVDSSDDVTCS